jgi:hypothetical protein
MKKSVLIHTFAALAIAATLPLGASAATPNKKTAEKGSVEKAHSGRKHYFAHSWLDS